MVDDALLSFLSLFSLSLSLSLSLSCTYCCGRLSSLLASLASTSAMESPHRCWKEGLKPREREGERERQRLEPTLIQTAPQAAAGPGDATLCWFTIVARSSTVEQTEGSTQKSTRRAPRTVEIKTWQSGRGWSGRWRSTWQPRSTACPWVQRGQASPVSRWPVSVRHEPHQPHPLGAHQLACRD
ncbi:hypothetical protein VTK73DRAFT_4962 [Phialemonium thermophilum]|uniref:Secreted protein n=1 Tax=Phialemonium thermophilum TaxID=223376 RepID=A0ABR3V4G3_9PEZI